MNEARITDPIKAQAAIAYLISEGWGIDLHALKQSLPDKTIRPDDWLNIANGCMDYVMGELAKEKVIPIARFRK